MLGRLRFGVIPLGGEGEARVEAFVRTLSGVLGAEIDVHYSADYRALVSAIEQGLAQFAWLPPLAAARAVRAGNVTPAAVASRPGATSYLTGLIALESRGLRTIADLKNLRAAWVDRESASGYVVIRSALRQQGVSLVDAFADDLFCRSHAEVARAIETGRVDVGATCFNAVSSGIEIARSTYNAAPGETLRNVVVIAQAGPIPSDIFAVHRSVAPGTLAKIETAFVGARPAHLFEAAKTLMFADGFARPDAEHHRMLDVLYESVLSENAPRSIPPPRFAR